MPGRPSKPCSYPGCGVLISDGSSRCPKHPAKPWSKSGPQTKRITGRRLQRMRAELFQHNPLCVACEALGITRLATQRDHVIPLAEQGEDVRSNTQGLCDECHEAKTQAESARGVRRPYHRGGEQ